MVEEKIVSGNQEIADNFNSFFGNIVPNLNIKPINSCENIDLLDESIESSISKYKNHPSILKIFDARKNTQVFNFNQVEETEIGKEIKLLDARKASTSTDTPVPIIKDNQEIFEKFLTCNFNNMIEKSIFPTQLKLAEVKPIFKKGSKLDMTNYRPVSILPTISKIYERCMYRQISSYFEHNLSKYQCGFRKGFSTQHALIVMIEKWRQSLDKKKVCGALLTDLSKAFDCLPHDLLIAKLHAYGFGKPSLALVHSYLSGRKQRVKIENTFSTWFEISYGVPQGSISGRLLFNIYICDIFMFTGNLDMMSYADDNTPFVIAKEMNIVIID